MSFKAGVRFGGWNARATVRAQHYFSPHHVSCLFAAALGMGCGDMGEDTTRFLTDTESVKTPAPPLSLAQQRPIVFYSDRAGDGVGDLYLMSEDGSDVTRVTWGGDFSVPEWSPDGNSIAFRRIVNGQNADIGLVSPDGSPPVLLTEGESPLLSAMAVHWSADGERIGFTSLRGPGEMYVLSVARSGGAEERLLPHVAGNQEAATWSWSDGSRIAYSEYAGQRTRDIWLTDSEASPPTNLTTGRVHSPHAPRWSPDGTRIAFSGYAILADGTPEGLGNHGPDGTGAPDIEIFVIEVETGELTRLTDDTSSEEFPTWTPDGNNLLVSSDRDGDYDLWLLPLEPGGEAENLIDDTALPFDDRAPHWYLTD